MAAITRIHSCADTKHPELRFRAVLTEDGVERAGRPGELFRGPVLKTDETIWNIRS
jgi:hypothetical protein